MPHGLRVTSAPTRSVVAVQPNSGIVVEPMGMTPVSRNCRVKPPSTGTGSSGSAWDPIVIGIPATWMLSFVTVGTPPKAPRGRWSLAARDRARSTSEWASALRTGLTSSIRAIAASTTSRGVTSPAATRAATSVASPVPRASSAKAWTRDPWTTSVIPPVSSGGLPKGTRSQREVPDAGFW